MDEWTDIIDQYGGLVWQTAWRLLNNHADTADCFQDTFIAALRVSQTQKVHKWGGLLQRLATTRALDLLRRRLPDKARRAQATDVDTLADGGANQPSVRAENDELADQLRFALTQLPTVQAEAYCLRHLNDMSYQQISEELGISIDSVGVALHRARARLRELLGNVAGIETRGEP